MSLNYRIEVIEGRGKLLVATKDMLPGTVVLVESPLMYVSNEYKRSFADEENYNYVFAAVGGFSRLSPEDQWRYLELFGPTTSEEMESIRGLGRAIKVVKAKNMDASVSQTPAEVETFVKVYSICKFNCFDVDDGMAVYETTCRMSHSCSPNCGHSYEGQVSYIRAIAMR